MSTPPKSPFNLKADPNKQKLRDKDNADLRLSTDALIELRAVLNRLLICSQIGSADRRNILASLENLDRVFSRRLATYRPSL
ncbi:hypothetical protein [Roseobacter sp.]|uniref:hypothetical protein n=1 Tax=Roseobacter sp. TaxID=1907202 RepID=UPI00385AC81E